MVSGAGSRGCDPREGPAAPRAELAQLSFTWLFLSWLFIDGVFLVREAQLAPPALHLQEDKEMELGEGAQLLPPPHVAEAVPGVPRGSSEPLPGSAPGPAGGACFGSHSWREMKLLKPFLWLWQGVVNPQLASGVEHGVKSVQCLPIRHKRIK